MYTSLFWLDLTPSWTEFMLIYFTYPTIQASISISWVFILPDRERDADRDRDRDSLFRLRERRWLDNALREDGTLSRLDRDRTDGLLSESKKQTGPPQSPIAYGEELQYWPEKVWMVTLNIFFKLPIAATQKHPKSPKLDADCVALFLV